MWFPGECGIAILSPSSCYLMMHSSTCSLGRRTSALLAWTAPRPAKLWAPGLPQEPSRILARGFQESCNVVRDAFCCWGRGGWAHCGPLKGLLYCLGVLVLSWYPPGMADDNGEPSDDLVPAILDTAHQYNIQVSSEGFTHCHGECSMLP